MGHSVHEIPTASRAPRKFSRTAVIDLAKCTGAPPWSLKTMSVLSTRSVQPTDVANKVGARVSGFQNPSSRPDHTERAMAIATAILPAGALAFAVARAWQHHAVSFLELTTCASMYLFTSLGVTLGFHRFFTHRSFECTPVVAWTLA